MDIEEDIEYIRKVRERFNNGKETIEDILNYCRNYRFTFENGIKMRLVEKKYLDRLIKEYKNLLAEREKDKKKIEELEEENRVQRHQIMEVFDRGYIHKDKIKEIKNKFNKEYHKIYIKSNILSEKEKLNLEEKAKLQECTVLMQEIGCFIDNLQEILEDK